MNVKIITNKNEQFEYSIKNMAKGGADLVVTECINSALDRYIEEVLLFGNDFKASKHYWNMIKDKFNISDYRIRAVNSFIRNSKAQIKEVLTDYSVDYPVCVNFFSYDVSSSSAIPQAFLPLEHCTILNNGISMSKVPVMYNGSVSVVPVLEKKYRLADIAILDSATGNAIATTNYTISTVPPRIDIKNITGPIDVIIKTRTYPIATDWQFIIDYGNGLFILPSTGDEANGITNVNCTSNTVVLPLQTTGGNYTAIEVFKHDGVKLVEGRDYTKGRTITYQNGQKGIEITFNTINNNIYIQLSDSGIPIDSSGTGNEPESGDTVTITFTNNEGTTYAGLERKDDTTFSAKDDYVVFYYGTPVLTSTVSVRKNATHEFVIMPVKANDHVGTVTADAWFDTDNYSYNDSIFSITTSTNATAKVKTEPMGHAHVGTEDVGQPKWRLINDVSGLVFGTDITDEEYKTAFFSNVPVASLDKVSDQSSIKVYRINYASTKSTDVVLLEKHDSKKSFDSTTAVDRTYAFDTDKKLYIQTLGHTYVTNKSASG